jgi:ubiquinone/menaquinone biosynthesis C-methylase UbiE
MPCHRSLAFALLLVACRPAAPAPPRFVAEADAPDAGATAATVHDPAHPPIDCPLHKQGIVTEGMRPFDEVEKYIAFLEKPERAAWQKPDDVVAALNLHGNETVADLGAGGGYFTVRLAKALPRGRVYAEDTEPEMLRHIHHRALGEGVGNVEVVAGKAADPLVPGAVDLVFVCDVLHHVADRAAWLSALAREMKPGARLALLEFKEGPLPEGPPESVKLTRTQILALTTSAGLVLREDRPDLLPYQTFLVFAKP